MAIVAVDFIDNMINDVAWWFWRGAILPGLILMAFVIPILRSRHRRARSHTKPSHAATPTPTPPPPGLTEATDTGRDTPTLTEGAHPTRAPRGGQTPQTTEHSWPPPVTPLRLEHSGPDELGAPPKDTGTGRTQVPPI